MAFREDEQLFHEKTIEWYLAENRPPEHIRPELDLSCKIEGQSVIVYEIRPYWQDRTQILEHAIAKTTFIRTQDQWKIFWQRADLNWHGYEPEMYVDSLTAFFRVVKKDRYGCFFG